MNRRGFLRSLGVTAVALALTRTLPGIAPSAPIVAPPPALATPLQRGDVFTIAGRFTLDSVTGRPTSHLQSFVVTDVVTETR